jgi:transcription antitermination factor NusG
MDNKIWHVVYTRSRAEKKVHADLTAQGIECFLPVQKRLRQWKDRKKWVDMPVIPGYCFVHISRRDYDRVLQTSNVVAYVVFEQKTAVIPGEQIKFLKQMIQQSDFEVEVTQDTFRPGKKVEIINGPLMGVQGELFDARGKNRFTLRIKAINTTFVVNVPSGNLTFTE